MGGIEFADDDDGAQIKVSIKPLPEGGQGLSWDVFGPELRDTPILFPPEEGAVLSFVGTEIELSSELLVLSQYGLGLSGGGSFFLGYDALALDQYDITITSGSLILVGSDDLEVVDYSIEVTAGNVLLLTDGTPLLLTDGTPLFLEAA